MPVEKKVYTRFEKARIIGARALQISFGAPIMIEVPKDIIDPVVIAEMEFEKNVIPIFLATHNKEVPPLHEYMEYLKNYFKITLQEWITHPGAVIPPKEDVKKKEAVESEEEAPPKDKKDEKKKKMPAKSEKKKDSIKKEDGKKSIEDEEDTQTESKEKDYPKKKSKK